MADYNHNQGTNYDYPAPDPVRDRRERGEDPSNVHYDEGPGQLPPLTDEQRQRKHRLGPKIDVLVGDKRKPRQEAVWPYLLVRSYLGDHGVRPAPNNYFWESPDILLCQGVLSEYDPGRAVLNPVVGQPHTLFVRVWNLGRLAAFGVNLRVYWANPSFAFSGSNLHALDPSRTFPMPAFFDLPDRRDPDCRALIRVPDIWTPVLANGGHECLLAQVDCFTDVAGPSLDANANRHVGQRNVNLVMAAQNLMPLLGQLGQALPRNADIQLLHGMADVRTVLQANAPNLADRLRAPRRIPEGAYPLAGGYAHLGALIYQEGKPYLVPADVVGPRFSPAGVDHALLTNPAVRPVNSGQPLQTLITQAGSDKQPRGCFDAWLPTAIGKLLHLMPGTGFTAGQLAQRLGARPGEGHLIRIVASDADQVVGGYSIIVQG